MKSLEPPPRWLLWLSASVVLVGAGMTLSGAVLIGVSADEGFHVTRLQNFLSHGWYLLDDDLADGEPGSWVSDRWVYAPATTLLLHAVNVILGIESSGQVSASASAYVVRHVGTATIGLLGVLVTAWTTRRLFDSWRWGAVSAGVLLATPMWSGHAMFNVKDIPVATGYTLVTLGCVMTWQSARHERTARLVAVLTIVSGLVLVVGTRPGLWPGPVAAIGTVGLAALWPDRVTRNRAWWRWGDIVAGVLAATALLAATYPEMFLHPVRWIAASVAESPGNGGTDPGPAYIPVMVMSTVPIVILLCGTAGLVFEMLGARRGRPSTLWSFPLLLVAMQTLLVPALTMATDAALSGLLRHLLFACPTGAILLTVGIATTLRSMSGVVARATISGMLAVGLLLPVAVQVQLFPYSYSYVNEVVDAARIDYAPDYWRASYRELLANVPSGEFVVCSPALTADGRALRRMEPGGQSLLDLSEDCRTSPGSVIEPYLDSLEPMVEVSDSFISMQQVEPDVLPTGCTEVGRVERRRHVAIQVVSIASRCPLVLEAYAGPISFDLASDPTGARYLLGGWSGDGASPWIETRGRSHLGVEMGDGVRGKEIHVHGSTDGAVQFLLNNQPVESMRTPTGWVLPSTAVPVLGSSDNLVLTVVPDDGESVRLTDLEVVRVLERER